MDRLGQRDHIGILVRHLSCARLRVASETGNGRRRVVKVTPSPR